VHRFRLEDLYRHHDADIVVDTIPAVIAWLPRGKRGGRKSPVAFQVSHEPTRAAPTSPEDIQLSWDLAALAKQDHTVEDRARRYEHGRTVHREHLTELAGYGLALVAIAVLMPGRRVVAVRLGLPPDLLFDITPKALRGVEVAARSTGGLTTLRATRRAKAADLMQRADVVEAHLSLWCGRPRVAIHAMVKL
jgi:hypothetical protein